MKLGNYVPADCRLIESFNFKVDESILTGEAIPVLKDADKVTLPNVNEADMINMAFATTIVVNGHAKGIVTKIGMDTRVGSIAKAIITDEAPQTPIQRKLEEVGKILGILTSKWGFFFIIIIPFFIIFMVELFAIYSELRYGSKKKNKES